MGRGKSKGGTTQEEEVVVVVGWRMLSWLDSEFSQSSVA